MEIEMQPPLIDGFYATRHIRRLGRFVVFTTLAILGLGLGVAAAFGVAVDLLLISWGLS
jgi:hypothetical protein